MILPNFNNPHQRIYSKIAQPHSGALRAKEIQYLLDKGYNQSEIADQIGMRPKNVSDYVRRYSLKMVMGDTLTR